MAFRWRSDSGQRLMLAGKVFNIVVVTIFILQNWSLTNIHDRLDNHHNIESSS